MRSVTVIAPAGTGASAPIILDQHLTSQDVGLAIVLSAGASLTTKVQWSLDDPYGVYATSYTVNATWFDDKNLITLVANAAGVPVNAAGLRQPIRAVRLNNTIYASGTASLTAAQMGGIA